MVNNSPKDRLFPFQMAITWLINGVSSHLLTGMILQVGSSNRPKNRQDNCITQLQSISCNLDLIVTRPAEQPSKGDQILYWYYTPGSTNIADWKMDPFPIEHGEIFQPAICDPLPEGMVDLPTFISKEVNV